MITKENIEHCIKVLSKEINNNIKLSGTGNTEFRLLCTAQGDLKVLLQRLNKNGTIKQR